MRKICALLALTFFTVITGNTQNVLTEGLRTRYGAFIPYRMTPSQQGGAYLSGSALIIQQAKSNEAYVAAIDEEGNLLWSKSFLDDDNDNSAMTDLVELNNGGVCMITALGKMIKLKPDHSVEFAKAIKLPTYSIGALAILHENDGGFVIAGTAQLKRSAYVDAYLLKTDSNGNPRWSKRIMNDAKPRFIIKTSDGGFAIAGTHYPTNPGKGDFLLVKTDSLGNNEWETSIDIDNLDRPTGLIETSDKGFIITGSVIMKFSDNGSVMWIKKITATGFSSSVTNAVLSTGHPQNPMFADKQTLLTTFTNTTDGRGCILYSLTNNSGVIVREKSAMVDSLQTGDWTATACTDYMGNIWTVGTHVYPGLAFVINKSLPAYKSCHTANIKSSIQNVNGTILPLSFASQSIDVSTTAYSFVQQASGYTTILKTCTKDAAIEVNSLAVTEKKQALILSPNPVNNVLHITGLDRSTKYVLTITDDKGTSFINTQVSYAPSFDLNVKTLKQHVYYLRISSCNNTVIKTFIKQ